MSYLKHLVTLSCLSVVVALLLSGCGNNSGGGSGGSLGGDSGSRSYSIGGTVRGLKGSVVLQNNGGDDLTVDADSDFTFVTSLNDGESYSVSVLTQPSGQNCTASSNSGTVSGADVTSVSVLCATNPTLHAEAESGRVILSWDNAVAARYNAGAVGNIAATRYNLYYATEPDCDIANYAGCAGGVMIADVDSPYVVNGLANDQNYWFYLEAVAEGGNAVSDEKGAHPNHWMPDGPVYAIANDADGNVYLGGAFAAVGPYTGGGVPLSPSSGKTDGAYPRVDGFVSAVAADGAAWRTPGTAPRRYRIGNPWCAGPSGPAKVHGSPSWLCG
jgi:hypothetical protein